MLVCNVSLLHRRAGIAADIAEIATALDQPGTGNVVFATLVDDPASVREHVDAYLGEIMIEAASASSVINAGLIYSAAVVEAAGAIETVTGTISGGAAAMVEAATATATQDGSKITGSVFSGVLALDGPISPSTVQPTVIYIEG